MNSRKRMYNLRAIAPDYPRIPHLSKHVSNMTHDDIELEYSLTFPLTIWTQEKVDGSNIGASWNGNPILRNRNHILKKAYIEKDTPAKLQFRPAWNWINDHRKDLMFLSNELKSQVVVYGEWMVAKHSLEYTKLPDWFLAYDLYIPEERKFLSPDVVIPLMRETGIYYIPPKKMTFKSLADVVSYSEENSLYRNGYKEGIVLIETEGDSITKRYKVVNKYFNRREDFNDIMIKNKLLK